MKKILFLLLCTVSMYGQTYQNPTFGTVKTMTAPTVTTPPTIATVEANGTIGKIAPENIPINISPQPINYTIADNKIGTHLKGIDNKIGSFDTNSVKDVSTVTNGTGTATDALNTLNILKASLDLDPIVVNSTQGYFTKGGVPFIHNFYAGVNPLQGGTGNNLNIGVNSGNFNSDNFNYASTMVGFESGLSNKNGYSNVGIGYRNLHLNQNGFGNSALGTYVLGNLTSGTQNTSIGWHSMLYSTTASENTAIGVEALWNNLVGLRNTALGMRAGASNIGNDNVFIGYNAGGAYTGSNKLFIANINRTLIGGDFSGDGFIRLNGAGEFVVAPSRKITFKNPTGGEASLGWFNDLNAETNAYLDAFDYRIRTGGVVRLQIANSGAATFSSSITATSYTGGATLTNDPKAPTATAGDNDTSIATTAFVKSASSSGTYTPVVTNLVNATSPYSDYTTYTRIGNVVTVIISAGVKCTTANTNTAFTISLPISRNVSFVRYIGNGALNNYSTTRTVIPATIETTSATTATILFLAPANGSVLQGFFTLQYLIE